MLNFDEAKFLENQRGAVACAEELHGVIEDLRRATAATTCCSSPRAELGS